MSESSLFLIFRNGAVRTDESAHTKPGYVTDPDIMIEWVIVDDDKIGSNYLRTGKDLLYSPPVAPDPLTLPNPDKLLALILSDVDAPVEIYAYSDLIKNHSLNETSRKAFWAKVSGNSPAWLTKEFTAKIAGFAEACNLPLI